MEHHALEIIASDMDAPAATEMLRGLPDHGVDAATCVVSYKRRRTNVLLFLAAKGRLHELERYIVDLTYGERMRIPIDQRDESGTTLVWYAYWYQHVPLFLCLREHFEPDMNIPSDFADGWEGSLPLHVAVLCHHHSVGPLCCFTAYALRCTKDVAAVTARGNTFIHLAAMYNYWTAVCSCAQTLSTRQLCECLTKRNPWTGSTPMDIAVQRRHVMIMRYLYRLAARKTERRAWLRSIAYLDGMPQRHDRGIRLLLHAMATKAPAAVENLYRKWL